MNKRERKQYIKKLYDRSASLTVKNTWYREQVKRYLLDAIQADAYKDVTTKPVTDRNTTLLGSIVLREAAIVAGVEEVMWVLKQLGVNTSKPAKDGKGYPAGSNLLTIEGNARRIFAAERTIVNALQRMSGIATASNEMVQSVGKSVVVASTRKTLWGALDKKAAYAGKALTHRLGLFDGVMLKDNHVALLNDMAEIDNTRFPRKLSRQLEVDTMVQLKQVFELELEVDSILLDNFSPAECKKAIVLAKKMKQYQYYLFEASGGIEQGNCRKYVGTGVDVISSGALTHSAPAIDVSLDILEVHED